MISDFTERMHLLDEWAETVLDYQKAKDREQNIQKELDTFINVDDLLTERSDSIVLHHS